MKGWKLIARAALQNARMPNASKDHPSGKEARGAKDGDPYYYEVSEDNLNNVLPVPREGKTAQARAVTLAISPAKLARVHKRVFPGRG